MNVAGTMLRGALGLAAVGLLAVLLLAGIERLSRDSIRQAEHQAELDALSIVLPPERYDNAALDDAIQVIAPHWLGSEQPLRILRARQHGAASALVLQAVAPDGYAGPIALLICIQADGVLGGVRVTRHHETPGLGDKIEATKSPWINGFKGRSLNHPQAERWRVRKDGGEFDQFAGATVTPRAVVHAIHRALQFSQRHGAQLYAAKPGQTLHFDDAPNTHP